MNCSPSRSAVGQIIEIDRSHLAVARGLDPAGRRFAAKVLHVERDEEHPGWAYLVAYSDRRGTTIALAVPPRGARWIGPRVRVIRS